MSCKKDYTCDCTVTTGGASTSVTYEIKDAKKKDAESTFEGYNTSSSAGGVTSETKCSLK